MVIGRSLEGDSHTTDKGDTEIRSCDFFRRIASSIFLILRITTTIIAFVSAFTTTILQIEFGESSGEESVLSCDSSDFDVENMIDSLPLSVGSSGACKVEETLLICKARIIALCGWIIKTVVDKRSIR